MSFKTHSQCPGCGVMLTELTAELGLKKEFDCPGCGAKLRTATPDEITVVGLQLELGIAIGKAPMVGWAETNA